MKKGKRFVPLSAAGFLICLCILTGCGQTAGSRTDGVQTETGEAGRTEDGQAAGGVTDGMQTEAGVAENGQAAGSVTDSVQAERTEDGQTAGSGQPISGGQQAEYSYHDIFMSLTIPDGWDYRIKTAEEMEKNDGMSVCAIDFWSEEYPDTVFCLSYETSFGLCGTGVTVEEFGNPNGVSGYRYTEEIEDTLWLCMTFKNPDDEEASGTYCLMASPALSEWEALEPEFDKIAESIWVGGMDAGQGKKSDAMKCDTKNEENIFDIAARFQGNDIVISKVSADEVLNTIPIANDAYRVFLSMADAQNGYMLYCSSPAMGLMTKYLYVTEDGWNTYRTSDISSQIDGYPTGITAISSGNIYVGTQMRSEGYLFETTDNGENWTPVAVDKEKDYFRYGYAPFIDNDAKISYALMEYDGDYFVYQSADDRRTWEKVCVFSLDAMIESFLVQEEKLYVTDLQGEQYCVAL